VPLVGCRGEPPCQRAEREVNLVVDLAAEGVAERFERFAVRRLILAEFRALDFELAALLVQLLRAGEVLVAVDGA
jgi:hypothetical protein